VQYAAMAGQEKTPRRERRGQTLFLVKEVTANSVAGYRYFIVVGSGSCCCCSYCSSGV
jgi:hypothetical protein